MTTVLGNRIAFALTGSAGAKLVSLLVLPLLARILGPDLMGLWAVVQAVATAVLPLATLRLEIAVVLPKAQEDAQTLAVGALFSCIAGGLLAGFAAIVLAGLGVFDSSDLNNPDLVFAVAVACFFTTLGSGLDQITYSVYVRESRFGHAAIGAMVYSVAWPAIALVAVWLTLTFGSPVAEFDSYFVSVCVSVGMVISAIVGIWLCRSFIFEGVRCFSIRRWVQLVRSYKNYPLYILPYSYSRVIVERLLIALLVHAGGLAAAGTYLLVRQLTISAATAISSGVRGVWFGYLSKATDPEEIEATLMRFVRTMVLVGGCMVFALALFHHHFVAIVLGERWAEAADLAIWLLPACFTLTITDWLDRTFDVKMRQKVLVVLQVSGDAVLLAILAYLYFGDAELTSIFMAFGCFLGVYGCTWLYATLRFLNIGVLQFCRKIAVTTIPLLALYGLFFWLGSRQLDLPSLIVSGVMMIFFSSMSAVHMLSGFGIGPFAKGSRAST